MPKKRSDDIDELSAAPLEDAEDFEDFDSVKAERDAEEAFNRRYGQHAEQRPPELL